MKPYKLVLLPYDAYIGPPAKDGTEAFRAKESTLGLYAVLRQSTHPKAVLKAFRPS